MMVTIRCSVTHPSAGLREGGEYLRWALVTLEQAGLMIYGDHLAWPLVVGALLVIAKRGARGVPGLE
jgi:hypothetical protein